MCVGIRIGNFSWLCAVKWPFRRAPTFLLPTLAAVSPPDARSTGATSPAAHSSNSLWERKRIINSEYMEKVCEPLALCRFSSPRKVGRLRPAGSGSRVSFHSPDHDLQGGMRAPSVFHGKGILLR